MDVFYRMTTNIFCAQIFALYFYLQMCSEVLQIIAFVVGIPLAKVALDRMVCPIQIEEGLGYPIGKLFSNFFRYSYGLWGVILIETVRRIVTVGFMEGFLSTMLMMACLLVYNFSATTGICSTNTKTYRRGTIGFVVIQWLLIGISLLMGSAWVLR